MSQEESIYHKIERGHYQIADTDTLKTQQEIDAEELYRRCKKAVQDAEQAVEEVKKSLRNARNERMAQRNALQNKRDEEFRKDALEEAGLTGHPKADSIYAKA